MCIRDSHGIASLHLQHVGSDRTLWRGSVFGLEMCIRDSGDTVRVVDAPPPVKTTATK